MAGDNGGGGIPGSEELYVQRPAGTGNPQGQAWRGAWAVYRRNLDGSEPRYYLSNAPEDTMLETLAYVGGSRWRIESEFETEKGDVGLDEAAAQLRTMHALAQEGAAALRKTKAATSAGKDLGEAMRLTEVVDAKQLSSRSQAVILSPWATAFVGCIVLIHHQAERSKIGFPCL